MRKKRTPASKGDGADGTTTFTANNSPGDLKTLIHEHSLFFDQLVELIPARLFLPYSDDDKPWFLGLFMSEKKFKVQTRKNIIKSYRDRLDPTQPSSTLDLLKKMSRLEESGEEDYNDDEEKEKDQEQHEVGEIEKAHLWSH
jgi:60S ribosome biogenesis protein Rrp14